MNKHMKFAQAFKLMKQGAKVKRPSWGGYWYWDEEKQTIMMQCRAVDSDTGKELLDIRETQRVEYTIGHMLKDDWILADESNCEVLGGEPTFSFGEAIGYLKRGMKVKRKGWNGKGMYVFLATNVQFTTDADMSEFFHPGDEESSQVFVADELVMRTAQATLQPGWLASQADMLAEDWMFA